jgi:hypothetical protein
MMKRSLAVLAAVSTLIAGHANAAEDFKVGLSGFLNAGFLVQDVSDTNKEYDMASIRTDNVINVEGSTVLDNGLKVGAVAGFSLDQNASQNNIYQEELYASVGGAFGDVNVGRRRNAASLLHTFIPSAGIGTYAVDDARTNSFVGGITGMTTATSLDQAEYANRIMYFTPRVEGVQLAASFTPETDPNVNFSNDGFNRYQGSAIQNEYSLGGNYTRDFGGLVYNGSIGYTAGDAPAASGLVQDSEAYHAGASLGYAGVTAGGAWGFYKNPIGGNEQRYGGGLKYETGPYTFGGSALRRETTTQKGFALANGQDVGIAHLYEVGAKYALGPGVSTGVGVYYNDNQKRKDAAGTAEDSIAGLVNLSVNF